MRNTILVGMGLWSLFFPLSIAFGIGNFKVPKPARCENLRLNVADDSTSADKGGLTEVCKNTSPINQIEYFFNPELDCQVAANRVGDGIQKNACDSPQLAGWSFHTITARGVPGGNEYCHDALLIVSSSGNHYYYDPLLEGTEEFFQMRPGLVNGEMRFSAAEKVKIPIFRFPSCKTEYYVFPGEKDGKKDPNNPNGPLIPAPKPHHFQCPGSSLPSNVPASRTRTCSLQPKQESTHTGRTVGSIDPNDKIGSRGAGAKQYISGQEPLRFTIFFENLETATASAQEVIITDQLDRNSMDLGSLKLGPISFGNRQVIPPLGVSEFSTEVDLRPENDLLVKIDVSLDAQTDVLTYRFTSLNPLTGEFPEDPLAGFLPPNVNPPEGDGSVLFTIMPLNNLLTGTEVRNKANIIFDLNAPIETPEWLNTIDITKPTSSVNLLEPIQTAADFEVTWTGTDEGAGIKDYSVFVSEDGEPFTIWQPNTTKTSGIFAGENGKNYAFYSVARDLTNNIEDAPSGQDSSTLIMVEEKKEGDLNGDSKIDMSDFQAFQATFGKCESQAGYNANANFDNDTCITFVDYQAWYGLFLAQQ